MKYVVLVSHGTFAEGLHSVLKMLGGGEREDILSLGLKEGMGTHTFEKQFRRLIRFMKEEDEIILLGDIMGGSPLTTALNILAEENMWNHAMAFGGMNLPMALNAVFLKDALDADILKTILLQESQNAIKEFVLETAREEYVV